MNEIKLIFNSGKKLRNASIFIVLKEPNIYEKNSRDEHLLLISF